jgi:hypothetical protein
MLWRTHLQRSINFSLGHWQRAINRRGDRARRSSENQGQRELQLARCSGSDRARVEW